MGRLVWPSARVTLSIFAVASTLSGCNEPLPSRRDCIIGYNLDWGASARIQYDVRNEMFPTPPDFEIVGTLVASIFSENGEKLYLQYRENCNQKEKYAERLVEHWKSNVLDLPEFIRIPDPIEPSAETISVRGPYWRDG